MMNKQAVNSLIWGLSIITAICLASGTVSASSQTVSGEIKDGYRILTIAPNSGNYNFTVYRGDYIKFRLPKELNDALAVFPTLGQSKTITQDLAATAYFKMKQAGSHPFEIGSLKGIVTVVEYSQSNYAVVSSKEAGHLIASKQPLILDVRTPREFKGGHLENAVLLPVQQLQKRLAELERYKHSPILIYCATGNRSTVASKILIDSGFTDVINLRYGIAEWARYKYPIVK